MTQETLLDLSRWQWALTAAFHITFPAITVGTSMFLVVCYAMYMRTDDDDWLRLFRFWRRIFAIGFAIGVVSGIVLTFQFGLNWGPFAHDVGPIIGVLIAMEVISAFFLEAGFLGLLVFGEGRISKRVMMFSTCMVSLGTLLSVTWILVANSWMQTPDGYQVVSGQFQPTNWLDVIFNPSFGIRFIHMLVGALISAGWFIAGISAWYLVKRRHLPLARRGVSVTLGVLALLVPLQFYIGDHVAGDYVAKYKMPQLQAMEGHWDSNSSAENIVVIPDQGAARNHVEIGIPWLGSVLGAKDWSGNSDVPGLAQTAPDLRPDMWPTFWGFHLMWYATMVMLLAVLIGVLLRLRGRLYEARWFHKSLVWLVPIGFVAIWSGWVLAETGRQPWLVYGQLLTADSVSPLDTWQVLASLIGFVSVYLALMGTFVYYVVRAVREGPGEGPITEPSVPAHPSGPEPSPRTAPAS